MPAQPTVMFTLFALRSLLCALLGLQSSLSVVITICSLHFMPSSLFPVCSTFPPRSTVLLPCSLQSPCSTVFTLCSLPPSRSTVFIFLALHSSLHSPLCSLQTLHPLLPYLLFYLLSYVYLHCLPFMFVCLAVICKFCGMWQAARWMLCIGCGSSSLSASSSRFTFVATKLGPAQLLNSLSCSTADSCCLPECTPTLPCAAGRHFDPIHLAHLSKKKEKKKHLFCSSFSLPLLLFLLLLLHVCFTFVDSFLGPLLANEARTCVLDKLCCT